MDGLRKRAREALEHSEIFAYFNHPQPPLWLAEIDYKAESNTYRWVGIRNPTSWLEEEDKRSSNGITASLTLLCIERRSDNDKLFIREALFTKIFEKFHLDPYILYLITFNLEGYYPLGKIVHEDGYESWGYFANVRGSHLLAWSYSPTTGETRGIFVGYPTRDTKFAYHLEAYPRLIAHPLALAFVFAADLLARVDRELGPEESAIVDTERTTGFNPWSERGRPRKQRKKFPLGVLSGSMSATSVVLALHSRFLTMATMLLEAVPKFDTSTFCASMAPPLKELFDESAIPFKDAVGILEKTAAANNTYIPFLQERTKIQLSVLVNLIAKEDANASIELAKDSKTVAIASKHDSSSMKAIAIMTMAFLPGTFFAALFAVPILKWDDPRVIQPNFWIYWAFTVPFTLVIFVLFLVISERQAIRKRKETLRQKEKVVRRTDTFRSDDDQESTGSPIDDIAPPRKRPSVIQRALRRRRTRGTTETGSSRS